MKKLVLLLIIIIVALVGYIYIAPKKPYYTNIKTDNNKLEIVVNAHYLITKLLKYESYDQELEVLKTSNLIDINLLQELEDHKNLHNEQYEANVVFPKPNSILNNLFIVRKLPTYQNIKVKTDANILANKLQEYVFSNKFLESNEI